MTPGGERETAGRLPLWVTCLTTQRLKAPPRYALLSMPLTSFVVTGTARRAAFRSRCPGYQRLLPGSPRGAGAEGKRKAASPMEAARSVTRHALGIRSEGRASWPAAPGEPASFAVSMKQHMAEGEGFEPPEGVTLQRFSRSPQSAALPSLRAGGASGN